jgi:glutamate-ammonia-ligase adenylyltransferase
MRDVLRVAETSVIFAELSDLAEACLTFVNQLLGGNDLTIVAMGKFGGREISYGADLDVVFVGDNVRAAQNLLTSMGQTSAEGSIASMDARLRPDGEKGPLVAPLAAYESYYRDRAQLWEIHALTRVRPLSGALQEGYLEIARASWRKAGQQPDLFSKIDNMLGRIQRDRGSGDEFLDFKTGTGGTIEAEFLVQALQMRAAIWEPHWEKAVHALESNDVISKVDGGKAIRSYGFLRRAETTLRRFEDKNVSNLPAATEEQQKLAARLGYKDLARFTKEYHAARETIRTLYQKYIKSTL